MSKRMFGKGDLPEFESPKKRKPFWQVMSLFGWLLVFFGLVCGVGFIIGLVYGEVFFWVPAKGRSSVLTFSFGASPFGYCFFMLVDLVMVFSIGWSYVAWIKKRAKKY